MRFAHTASSSCCASDVRSAERRLESFAGPRLAGKFYQSARCTLPAYHRHGYWSDTAAMAEAVERGGRSLVARCDHAFAARFKMFAQG